MKMLISYLYCNQGGVTSVIKQRVPLLLKHGWTVDAVFHEDNGGKYDLLKSGIRKVDILNGDFKNQVHALLNENQYDLHVIFDVPELLTLIDYHPKTKTIFEIHTSIISTILKYPVDDLRKANAIFVPSQWSKSTILRLFPVIQDKQVIVIPNMVNQSIFKPTGDYYPMPKTILWVGKFTELKNWTEAIEIGRLFIQEHSDWQMTMVTGGAPHSHDVKTALSEFILSGKIRNFNWLHNLCQEDLAKLYRGVARGGGFLLSTSKAESFCLVVHEAMRCGVPVISTRVGPISEVIKDNISGLLYQQGNINECVNKCQSLIEDDFREILVSHSRKELDAFDQHVLGTNFISTMNQVVQ